MTLQNLDSLDRVRFEWPEPLVIDLLCNHYGAVLPGAEVALAKLHQRVLRSLVDEDRSDGPALRGQFVAQCSASGLGADTIAKIEQAVFFELMRIVGQRFRNSPRLRDAYGDRLKAALPQDSAPAVRPAPVRPRIAGWRTRPVAA